MLTADQTARYSRQLLLPEIATLGQERIVAHRAAVAGDTPAHAIACRYAERAGFGATSAGAIDRDALAPTSIVRAEAARDVLAGCRAVMTAIRVAVRI